MKKYISFTFFLVFALCFILPVSAAFESFTGIDMIIPGEGRETDYGNEYSENESSEATVYTDEEIGLSFTVPAGWQEDERAEDVELMKVAYNKGNIYPMIVYGYADMTADGSVSIFSSADIDNDYFTVEEIAEFSGVSADKVSTVKYNGLEFYATEKDSISVLGIDVPIHNINMMYIKNGYIVSFQFMGDKDSGEFREFEGVLESIRIDDNGVISESTKNMYIFAKILFYTLIVILPNSIPVLIFRFLIKRKPVSKKSAKIFSIIYAALSFFVSALFFAIIGEEDFTFAFIVAAWGFVNYCILKCCQKDDKTDVIPVEEGR
ncbi:MAG: hypothetical protein IJE48_10250 [Clostridia bacterium]|nr:hypothetical protein [Clostridia bacterium]